MGNERNSEPPAHAAASERNDTREAHGEERAKSSGKERILKVKDHANSDEGKTVTGSKRKSEESSNASTGGIAIKVNAKPKDSSDNLIVKKKPSLSSVFNDDSDSEEEMPLECRMKMRNIGRDTATSSGPKSFNKGKQGFTKNSFKVFELSMKPRNNMEKKTVFDEK